MSSTRTFRRAGWIASLLLLIGLLVPATSGYASERQGAGAVYTLGNAAAGNAVLAFDRAADGRLTPAGTFPTGGLGSGAGLGSQGALALAEGGRLLFAVNAGSDDVSVLRVGADGLSLVDRVATPPYAAASGLLLWGARNWPTEDERAGGRALEGVGDRIGKLFKGLMP